MKIAATIAEYNPLHTGHLYHIGKTKEALQPDVFAVVMSGNFTQRGDIAVAEKHLRAAAAVKAGADVVLEIPSFYAVNCAEKFAEGALKTLSCFNSPLVLSFGSECGDIAVLKKLSETVHNEKEDFKNKIKNELKKGGSYPSARAAALGLAELDKPNDILALEYLHFAEKYGFDAFTVKREGAYNDNSADGKYASANAIRNYIFNGKIDNIKHFLPDYMLSSLTNCVFNNALGDMLFYKFGTMTKEEAARLNEVSEGLENRILDALGRSSDYESLCANVKTKRYTMARIKRIFLYALFGLDKADAEALYQTPPYARVLAAKSGREDVLSLLSGAGGGLILRGRDANGLSQKVRLALAYENKVDNVYAAASKQKSPFNAVFAD